MELPITNLRRISIGDKVLCFQQPWGRWCRTSRNLSQAGSPGTTGWFVGVVVSFEESGWAIVETQPGMRNSYDGDDFWICRTDRVPRVLESIISQLGLESMITFIDTGPDTLEEEFFHRKIKV